MRIPTFAGNINFKVSKDGEGNTVSQADANAVLMDVARANRTHDCDTSRNKVYGLVADRIEVFLNGDEIELLQDDGQPIDLSQTPAALDGDKVMIHYGSKQIETKKGKGENLARMLVRASLEKLGYNSGEHYTDKLGNASQREVFEAEA